MRRVGTFAMALLGTALLASAAFAQAAPPVAPIRPVTDDYFGTKVVDNYRYFENLKDPEVQTWMKAQADYTRQTLDALPGYPALLARVAALDASQPAQVSGVQIVAGKYYTLRTPAGAQSPKLYVRDSLTGADRLLIDPEQLSAGSHTHLSILGYRPSPSGHYIAYQVAAGGSEEPTLHVYDARAGKDLPETADRTYGDPANWRSDETSFFYFRGQKLEAGAPATEKYENGRVYLHVLGRPFDDDPPILGAGISDAAIALTPREHSEVFTAAGSRYALAIVRGAGSGTRVYAAPLATVRDRRTAWRPIAASYDDQYVASESEIWASAALAGDTLYWLSGKDAPRGRILRLDLASANSKPEVVVPQGELPFSAVYAARDAIYWRVSDAGVNSVRRLRVARGAQPETLRLPYAANIVGVSTDASSDAVVLSAASWLRAPAYLSADARTLNTAVTDLQPAGPYDRPDDLEAEEVRVKSWDGTLVPLSIVHRKGLELDGNNPATVVGYGAYGLSSSPHYEPWRRIWYERGGLLATCHVRGGGELGEAWHHAGFQVTKPNTWRDFIACAQYLIDHKYTSPRKLVGIAVSAGGIMIGRAIEERPDLFAAAIAGYPAADMLRFETTSNGPGNMSEFGTVKTEAGFKALYAMSPYANVKDGVKYPAMLIATGINDHRVAPWIPAKFAARLEAATASGKPVLLSVDYDAGHGGMGGFTTRQVDTLHADELGFELWQTGDPAFQPRTP
ncbi:MAG TPA: prolyl oligopeptidase family serine peptidase [Gemmatimonadaceae bacterium]|nr:prolyl oligopeptidase family serine peptidase [Gemmatimonadaceae bacterium]